jgi:hypothetical protein
MAKLSLVQGTTSKSIGIVVLNNSLTTGVGLTGLVYNTASLIAYWWQPGITAPAAITLATLSSATTSYSSGGFFEVDATHLPGHYRFDIPNACLTGATDVIIELNGATNMAPVRLEIELTATNNQDAVHGGMSALPNTACTTNASLITFGTGTAQLNVSSGKVAEVTLVDTLTTYTGNTVQTGDSYVRIGSTGSGLTSLASATNLSSLQTTTNTINTNTSSLPTATTIAQTVWQDTTTGHFTVSGSIGKGLFTSGNAPGTTNGLALYDGLVIVNSYSSGQDPATLVLGATASSWNTTGTIGHDINAAGVATDPWLTIIPGSYTSGMAGNVLGNLSTESAASIAQAVWQDAVSGDFTTAGSIGLLLTTNINATISSRLATSGYTTPPTGAAIATAILTDTTSGDYTTASSLGGIIKQLGGAFTNTSSSVFSTASLVNAGGSSGPTAAVIAQAVWQDLTSSSDFTTSGSIGKLLSALPTNFSSLAIDSSGRVILQSTGLDAITAWSGACTAREALFLSVAGIFGKISGLPTSPGTVKGLDGTTTTAVVAFDSNNNRTSITLTMP